MKYCAFYGHSEFVALSASERKKAMERGAKICCVSRARNQREMKCSQSDNGVRIQQLGELAGLAVAKALGIPWKNSLDTFRGADLDFNIEVRLLGVDWYGLRVYAKDYDAKRVVGCVIERGREEEPYRIPGWINAKFAKRPEWQLDPHSLGRPVFCVPQERLFPLSALRKLIKNENPNSHTPTLG